MRAHVDTAAVVDLTRALVRLDTTNPPGHERLAADVCRAALEPFGARFEEIEPAPGRTSLVASLGDDDPSRPTLVVNGHLDVVPVNEADWTRPPFAGEVDEGERRMYGRGSADMKGGVAAAICALSALRAAGREPTCRLVFHLVADEEQGGALGTQALVEQGFIRGAAACLVPEPTGLAVGVAERGLLVLDVTTLGRPAHGSSPRNGVSAVETAAEVVLACHAADFGDVEHPLLGTATCNAGVIAGGSSHNTVAERCTVTLGRRLLPGATLESSVAGIEARIATIDDPDVRYEHRVVAYCEPSEMAGDHPLAAAVSRAVTSVLGSEPGLKGMPFTTDARFVRNQCGVPAVVCGPGYVAQAHGNDEFVTIDQLVDATAAFATLYATLDAAACGPRLA